MLTNVQVKALKATGKVYRVADFGGLSIEVSAKGTKFWRFRYRFNKKASMISLGKYPGVSLQSARALRDESKLLLDSGVNPTVVRKDEINSRMIESDRLTFLGAYEEWLSHNQESWAYGYTVDLKQRCEKHLISQIGSEYIEDITPSRMIEVFKIIEKKGVLNTLKKVRGYASRVFRYSVGMQYCKHDPTRDLPKDIFKKEKPVAYSHTVNPDEVAGILRVLIGYKGFYSVRFALKMAPYIFLRPTELARLKWDYINFETKLITIPASEMKMGKGHLVPMSSQVLSLLRELREINTRSEWVFVSPRSDFQPINSETLLAGIRRSGITKEEFTTHGFRHLASTLLHEQGWLSDAIERQLSHVQGGVKGVYNQALHLDVRAKMMQEWSNYLDGLVAGSS